MPQPTSSDVHVNAPLTNISVAYIQDQMGFVADKVFPIVPVEHQSNLYYLFSKEDFLRDEALPRAPGTESAGGGFGLTTATYGCVVEAYHKDIDDQLRANADSVLSLDRAAAEFVAQKMLIRRERRWVTNFFSPGVWTNQVTPGVLWSTAATADPLADMELGKLTIQSATGMKPNILVLGPRTFSALRKCAQIKDQFKYTSSESINTGMLAGFFDVERVVVMGAVYTSTAEGAAVQTTDFIGGKHALLAHVAPNPSLMTPTAGYTFAWSGLVGSVSGYRTLRMRIDPIHSDRIEGESAYDMKKVADACGYFFNAAVA